VLKNDRNGLDYFQLAKRSRRLETTGLPRLRIALLADVSTQHLAPILRTLFADGGVGLDLYEAPYDTIATEIFDPASGLYAFEPQVVVVLQSSARLTAAYYQLDGDRSGFVDERLRTTTAAWSAVLERTRAHLVQSTYVLPCDRAHGSFGAQVPGALQTVVRELNRELCARARTMPGVRILDLDELAGWVGRRTFLDERLWILTKSLCALPVLPEVAQSLVDLVLAALGRTVKCVVLDLDDTLWGGVVGDDGLEGIRLGDMDDGAAFHSFQLFLRELWRRGVLLAVCSKNDEAVARRVFREHPRMVLREEHLAAFVANWEDKASNLRRIRAQLDIGFDSIVFLDDNPFERNLVRQLLPEVIVPELPEDPALYVRTLCELNLFETASVSELDARRGAMYQDQARREEERERFSSLEEYLASLETAVEVRPFCRADLPRIAQLVQRSNQFNLTTRRYSEAECAALCSDPDRLAFTVSVRDRFGDFGLVAVAVLRRTPGALEIEAFLMSCRVLQRGVEHFAMGRVFDLARAEGVDRVVGRFLPTPKNGMVKDLLARMGFQRVPAASAGEEVWILPVEAYVRPRLFLRERPPVEPASAEAGA
jgi:FkbH-like protein